MGSGRKNKALRPINGKAGRGEKKAITRRDLMITFVAFFLVFFVVGYFRGRADRDSPERLKLYFAEITKENKALLQFSTDSSGKRRLSYVCPSNSYWYDVDIDKIYKDPSNTSPAAGASFEPAITRDTAFYSAFVIGTISAWSIKDVFLYVGLANQGGAVVSRVKLVVLAILGTVMGYEIGYWIATRTPPACDYVKYNDLLMDQKAWKSIEGAVWAERFAKAYEGRNILSGCGAEDANVRRVQEETLNNAITKLEQLRENVSELGHDYSSADFDGLDEFAKVKTEYLNLCSSQGKPPK